jgi:hypothetical protein
MGGGTSVEEDPVEDPHDDDSVEVGATAQAAAGAADAEVEELIEPTVVALEHSDEARVCHRSLFGIACADGRCHPCCCFRHGRCCATGFRVWPHRTCRG